MEVERVLHMKEGVGETSYANNSLLQRTVITKSGPILEESIRELYQTLMPDCVMTAEMGCSSGPNALTMISKAIDVIDKARRSLNRRAPQFGVFLNDLTGNDFNTMFNLLPTFYKRLEQEKGKDFGANCFVSGTPRSFYGRVFPDNFLHFVHSSYSLHWLSQLPKGMPMNKGNICIAKTSPPEYLKAYYAQFKQDFTLFLRSRAREMVPGGRIVLTFLGCINSHDPDSAFELLGSTLSNMVSEGLVEEEKLDNFNMPFYFPTVEETKELVKDEGSFTLNKLETFTIDWGVDTTQNLNIQAALLAKTTRAVSESLLTSAFGEAIMDELFFRYQENVKEHLARGERSEYFNILISMIKKG